MCNHYVIYFMVYFNLIKFLFVLLNATKIIDKIRLYTIAINSKVKLVRELNAKKIEKILI